METLTLHGTGKWEVASAPEEGRFPELDAVSASARGDAWAVGGCGPSLHRLMLHREAGSWTRVHTPSQGIGSILYGVAAFTRADALAVGEWDTDPFNSRPLLLTWDGAAWKRI